jgi:tyrosine-protein kinase Etk/Wzc
MPETQQEILRLSRDVESGRAVYMQLLNRQQELNIAKSSAIGNVRIIDNAVTQPKPVKPKKILIVLIGIILGVMVSAGVVLLRVFYVEELKRLSNLKNLVLMFMQVFRRRNIFQKCGAEKGWSKKSAEEIQGFLAVDNPADLAIEAIRGLRTSLHFAMMEARNNVLMISGASPNAGKTFVSSNLAAVISQTGKKVLFIDTDMRKGYTHKLFNENNTNGLSDILSGKVEINRALKKVASGGFDFISREWLHQTQLNY